MTICLELSFQVKSRSVCSLNLLSRAFSVLFDVIRDNDEEKITSVLHACHSTFSTELTSKL